MGARFSLLFSVIVAWGFDSQATGSQPRQSGVEPHALQNGWMLGGYPGKLSLCPLGVLGALAVRIPLYCAGAGAGSGAGASAGV